MLEMEPDLNSVAEYLSRELSTEHLQMLHGQSKYLPRITACLSVIYTVEQRKDYDHALFHVDAFAIFKFLFN